MTPSKELELFEQMVATGSMSEAGSKVGVSPSVVSKHISALEDRLGTRLFYRPTVGLELTASGRAYYAATILPKLRKAPASITPSAANDNVVIPYRRIHERGYKPMLFKPATNLQSADDDMEAGKSC
jgi:molybdenum-dependent DNA-binding transcriptional regulator ModE